VRLKRPPLRKKERMPSPSLTGTLSDGLRVKGVLLSRAH